VPDVIGLSSKAAAQSLHQAHLVVLGIYKWCFSTKPPGTVLHVSLPVGAMVVAGTNVSFDVAKWPALTPNGEARCREASGLP